MRLNQSHMKYIPRIALKSTLNLSNAHNNPFISFNLQQDQNGLILQAISPTLGSSKEWGKLQVKCDSRGLLPQHGSLDSRWRSRDARIYGKA